MLLSWLNSVAENMFSKNFITFEKIFNLENKIYFSFWIQFKTLAHKPQKEVICNKQFIDVHSHFAEISTFQLSLLKTIKKLTRCSTSIFIKSLQIFLFGKYLFWKNNVLKHLSSQYSAGEFFDVIKLLIMKQMSVIKLIVHNYGRAVCLSTTLIDLFSLLIN